MAGWSNLTNGSALDSEKGVSNFQTKAFCTDIDRNVKGCLDDSDSYEVKLRCLFDRVLSVFLNEVASRGCMRPIPPMLGDGRSLDLFNLFWVVRERGGLRMVLENGWWSFVVQDLGLDLRVSGTVKLIYAKYLSELEEWFVGSGSKSLGNGEGERDCGGNFGILSLELEKEFRGLLDNRPNQKIKDDRLALLEGKENGRYVDMDIDKTSELVSWDTKNRLARKKGVGKRCRDDDDKLCDRDARVTNKEYDNGKRKQESLSGLLNWLIQIATCPLDPSIRRIMGPSKWKELRVQAIRAREALLQKRHVDSNARQQPLEKRQKMHPSIYDEITDLSHQSSERLRCSGRLPTAVKSCSCSGCNSCSAIKIQLTSSCKTVLENSQKEETPVTAISSARKTRVGDSANVPFKKHVSVGPLFQASIPEWTGAVVESDSKWLGTRVWPSVDGEQKSIVGRDFIGRGRPDSCGCPLPGSVHCVRFHIAENRMKLKLELGSIFFSWRFDQMGEEVSLRWTDKEAKRFKDMIKLDPLSLHARFWDNASKSFHKKTMKDLLSYYFNVFVVCRRSYQNRVTPRDIDSDDDESEFGSFGESFGHEAVTVPGSNLLICSENRQCFDFE